MDKWGSSVAKATAMELVHLAGVARKSRRELQLCGKTLHIGVGEVQRHITPITARFFPLISLRRPRAADRCERNEDFQSLRLQW
jgi:hypothetical protein